MADTFGLKASYMSRIMRPMRLAPDIVEAILRGDEPSGLSLNMLVKEFPWYWDKQRVKFGFEASNEDLAFLPVHLCFSFFVPRFLHSDNEAVTRARFSGAEFNLSRINVPADELILYLRGQVDKMSRIAV